MSFGSYFTLLPRERVLGKRLVDKVEAPPILSRISETSAEREVRNVHGVKHLAYERNVCGSEKFAVVLS